MIAAFQSSFTQLKRFHVNPKNTIKPSEKLRMSIPDYSRIFPIEPRIEYLRSFSVVPPSEAFASLFLYIVFDYRQKKPLKYSILGCCYQFYE